MAASAMTKATLQFKVRNAAESVQDALQRKVWAQESREKTEQAQNAEDWYLQDKREIEKLAEADLEIARHTYDVWTRIQEELS